MTASRTLVNVAAECCRATALDGIQDFDVHPFDPASVSFDEAVAYCANDIGHLQGWPVHFFCNFRERFASLGSETGRLSSGLATALRWRCDRCR